MCGHVCLCVSLRVRVWTGESGVVSQACVECVNRYAIINEDERKRERERKLYFKKSGTLAREMPAC